MEYERHAAQRNKPAARIFLKACKAGEIACWSLPLENAAGRWVSPLELASGWPWLALRMLELCRLNAAHGGKLLRQELRAGASPELCIALIARGADVNARESQPGGRTPLELCALRAWRPRAPCRMVVGALLARPDLALEAYCPESRRTLPAEEFCSRRGRPWLARAIAGERAERGRWGGSRRAWLGAVLRAGRRRG